MTVPAHYRTQVLPRLLTAAFYLCVVAVCVLSLLPGKDTPQLFTYMDKLEHLTAYSTLGFLARIAIPRHRRGRTLVLLAVMGMLLEVLQGLVPGRQPDVMDALFNCAGLLLGAGMGSMLLGRFPALDIIP